MRRRLSILPLLYSDELGDECRILLVHFLHLQIALTSCHLTSSAESATSLDGAIPAEGLTMSPLVNREHDKRASASWCGRSSAAPKKPRQRRKQPPRGDCRRRRRLNPPVESRESCAEHRRARCFGQRFVAITQRALA